MWCDIEAEAKGEEKKDGEERKERGKGCTLCCSLFLEHLVESGNLRRKKSVRYALSLSLSSLLFSLSLSLSLFLSLCLTSSSLKVLPLCTAGSKSSESGSTGTQTRFVEGWIQKGDLRRWFMPFDTRRGRERERERHTMSFWLCSYALFSFYLCLPLLLFPSLSVALFLSPPSLFLSPTLFFSLAPSLFPSVTFSVPHLPHQGGATCT
jgi:hypothetical protein